jgi:hypothetical protein
VTPVHSKPNPIAPGPTQGQVPVSAELFGAELARSVVERTSEPGEGVQSLAARLSLSPSRVTRELGYLSVFTMRFCVTAVLEDDTARARVLGAFYAALWADGSWGPHASGLTRREADYEDAFNNPHPDYGRGYRLGRVFARWCRAREDVAVIELGARAYVQQLPRVLHVLRSTRVS